MATMRRQEKQGCLHPSRLSRAKTQTLGISRVSRQTVFPHDDDFNAAVGGTTRTATVHKVHEIQRPPRQCEEDLRGYRVR